MGASDLPVGRWGNSLAVRIPAKLARELGIGEGSMLQAEVLGPARLGLSAKQPMDMKTFVKRLRELHQRLPVTQPVVEDMRRNARY
jgi:antitoxin component of MazEF toxin-antitoxin module